MASPILVWDMDGNLIDSVHSRTGCAKTFADVLRHAYKLTGEQYDAAIDYYIGPGCGVKVETQYPECLDLLGLPKDRTDELVQAYLEGIYSVVYPIYPDVVECFRKLHSLGYKSHCVSTSMKTEFDFRDGRSVDHVEETMKENMIGSYFAYAFGGTRSDANKANHKAPIMEAFGVDDDYFRDNSSLIGDAENDMKIALQWGVALPVYVNRRGFVMRKIERLLEAKEVDPGSITIVSSLNSVPDVVHNHFRL